MKLADVKFSRMLSCYDVLRFLGVRFQFNTFYSASSMPFFNTNDFTQGKKTEKKVSSSSVCVFEILHRQNIRDCIRKAR